MKEDSSKTILIIQTAFIGDTILASHFAQAVKQQFPNSKVHFLLRKGNESVIQGLASVDQVWVWDKQRGKFWQLLKLIKQLRAYSFDYVFNLHRHFNSGLVAACMRSSFKAGFQQNPLSFFTAHKVSHQIPHHSSEGPWHEVQRNLQLLQLAIPSLKIEPNPKLYRPELPLMPKHHQKVADLAESPYFVLAPASVWFTKAWQEEQFRALTQALVPHGQVVLIGATQDFDLCERIRKDIPQTKNLCGKLNLLESAALMMKARRVVVNDSAPLHLASAVNAPTTAIFCSTVPEFGYFPLADKTQVLEVKDLTCRPCGLHGHRACPLGHFKCSSEIKVEHVRDSVLG